MTEASITLGVGLAELHVGFEKSTDMSHRLYHVTQFEIVGDYTLRVEFDDGTQQTIDFEPVLHGQSWGPLRDKSLFNQVTLDSVAHTLMWPNGADFELETLHNWPDYKVELATRAQQWESVAA